MRMRRISQRPIFVVLSLALSVTVASAEDFQFQAALFGLRAMSVKTAMPSDVSSVIEMLLKVEYDPPSEKRDADRAKVITYLDKAAASWKPRERLRLCLVAAACLPDPALVTRYSGAKVAIKDGEGFTPLMAAAQYNPEPKVVRELASFYELNAIDSSWRTALALACEFSVSPAVVEALLDAGASTRHSVKGRYPYDMALGNKYLRGDKALLQRLAP